MNQIDLLHAVVGVFGLGLITNSIFIIKSKKYYSFFSRTYFIEPASDLGKEKVKKDLEEGEYKSQRYGLSLISIGLGILALSWSIGLINKAGPGFFSLAIIVFIISFIMRRNIEVKDWFKKSGFLMWQPVTWQAWLIILVFGVLIILSFI